MKAIVILADNGQKTSTLGVALVDETQQHIPTIESVLVRHYNLSAPADVLIYTQVTDCINGLHHEAVEDLADDLNLHENRFSKFYNAVYNILPFGKYRDILNGVKDKELLPSALKILLSVLKYPLVIFLFTFFTSCDNYTKVYRFERMKVVQYGLDSMKLNKETYKIIGKPDNDSYLLDNDAIVTIYGNTMLYHHNGDTKIFRNWQQ